MRRIHACHMRVSGLGFWSFVCVDSGAQGGAAGRRD
jgi:hypothetical protein